MATGNGIDNRDTKLGMPVGMGSVIPLAIYSNPSESKRRKSEPRIGDNDCMIEKSSSFLGGQYLKSSSSCSSSICRNELD